MTRRESSKYYLPKFALLGAIAIGVAFSGVACDDSGGPVVDAGMDGTIGGSDTLSGMPVLTAAPTALDFEGVVVATTSSARSVTVTNTGTAGTAALQIAISGANATLFALGNNTCQGAMLAPMQSCTLSITFTPDTTGTKVANLAISGGGTAGVAVALTGTGLAPAALSITPSASAGGVVVGSTGTFMLTVTNNGGVPTGALSFAVGGPSGALFSPNTAGCSMPLGPGGMCTVTVTFTPIAPGPAQATITVTSGTLSAVSNVSGTGLAPGSLVIEPSSRNFGDVVVGVASQTAQFTVRNTGGNAVEGLSISIGGANPGDYSQRNNCAATLGAGAVCTVTVTFTPTAPGSRIAEVVATGSGNSQASAALQGNGIRPAQLTITPANQLFGSTAVGSDSSPITFTVRNTGGQDTGVLTFSKSGANEGDFIISQNNCGVTPLAPGGSCTILVLFRPTAQGNREASITVTANPGSTATATLSGPGVPPGSISVNPGQHAYGAMALSAHSDQVFVVSNAGLVPTGTVTASIGGANVADFTKLSDNCSGQVINPGVPCTIVIRFRPGAIGPRNGTLIVAANPGGTITVPLSGTGQSNAALSATPVQQDFGDVVVGLSTNVVVFTVRNNGEVATGTLVASQLTGAAGQANNFTLTDNCVGQILQPGAANSCNVSVRFHPVGEGAKMATVVVGDGVTTVGINVYGNGLPPPSIIVSPTPQSFPDTVIGETSSAPGIQFRVTNLGGSSTGPLTFTNEGDNPGDWVLDTTGCPAAGIGSGQSCTFLARFRPTSPAGAKAARIRVTGNADANASFAVAVSGVALRKTVIGVGAVAAATTTTNTVSRDHGDAPSAMAAISFAENGSNTYLTDYVVTCAAGRSTPCGPFTFSLTGTNASDFEIRTGLGVRNGRSECSSSTLAAGASCYKAVQIRPRDNNLNGPTTLNKQATFVIDSSDDEQDLSASLTGASHNPIYLFHTVDGNRVQTDYVFPSTVIGTYSSRQFGVLYDAFMPSTRPFSAYMTGADQGPFSVTIGDCLGTQAANTLSGTVSTCPTTLRFIPRDSRSHSAVINTRVQVVGVYPTGSPQVFTFTDSIGVSGTGTPRPNLEVVSAPANISTISGTDSAVVTVTFRNQAGTIAPDDVTATVTASGVSLVGAPGGTCNTPATNPLAPGATCTVTFAIDATPPPGIVSGSVNVGLSYTLNSNGFPLSGSVNQAIPVNIGPQLTVTPSGAFGSYPATATDTRTYTIRNVSATPIASSISHSLVACGTIPGLANFAITATTCTPSGLAPNGTCVVTVRFTSPDQPTGSESCAILRVEHSPSNARVDTEIRATGLGRGVLEFVPRTDRYFGSSAAGALSSEHVVRIRNVGAFNTGTLVPTIAGGNASTQFVIDTTSPTPAGENRCGTGTFTSLNPGQDCVYLIRLFPSSGSLWQLYTQFSVAGDFGGTDTGTISLYGNALPVNGLTISPTFRDFGSTVAGTNGATQVFTVTNGTGAPQDIGPFILDIEANAANTQFTITASTCPAILPPAGGGTNFCTLTVRYNPAVGTTGGTRDLARLVLGPGNTWAALEGRVQAPASLRLTPSQSGVLSLGTATVGTALDTVFTLVNDSPDVAATGVNISLTGPNVGEYSIQNNGCATVPAGDSCQFTLRLLAISGNFKNATIGITYTAQALTTGPLSQPVEALALVVPSLAISPDAPALGGSTPVTGRRNDLQLLLIENSIFAGPTGPLSFTLSDPTNWELDTNADGISDIPSCNELAVNGEIRLGQFQTNFACTVGIRHVPRANNITSTGPQSVTLTVSGTPGGTATETVTAQVRPAVVVSPGTSGVFCASLDTGYQEQTFTFSLDPGANATTERIQTRITGEGASNFGIADDACAGNILFAGLDDSCDITVGYRPQTAGATSATLEVIIRTTDGIIISRSVNLSGNTACL